MSPTAFDVPRDPSVSHRAMLYPAETSARVHVLLVLAHGAGAGQSHPFITRYARGLSERGLDVVTFNFPYMDGRPGSHPNAHSPRVGGPGSHPNAHSPRVGGPGARRSTPDRAPVLEDTFRRVVAAAAAHRDVHATRLVIGGKSMGGRIATHLAAAPESWPGEAPPLAGVIVLGYPLNPPSPRLWRTRPSGGRGDRVSHLFKISVPTLIVQGTRDSFGGPDDVRGALAGRAHSIDIYPVDTGDHSLAVLKSSGKTQDQVDREIWDGIVRWLTAQGSRLTKNHSPRPNGKP